MPLRRRPVSRRGPAAGRAELPLSRCRRTHGHFAAYTAAAAAAITLTEAKGLRWYVADGRERGFCCGCGASIFWRRTGSEQISIAAGTIDSPTGLHTSMHIFTESRGDYYEISDELPRLPAGSDGTA